MPPTGSNHRLDRTSRPPWRVLAAAAAAALLLAAAAAQAAAPGAGRHLPAGKLLDAAAGDRALTDRIVVKFVEGS